MIVLLDLYQVWWSREGYVQNHHSYSRHPGHADIINADPEPDCLPKNWPDECHGK